MSSPIRRTGVAILGSGQIATDLLMKVQRSSLLECVLFAGRNPASPGLARARSMGVLTSDRGVEALLAEAGRYQIVFDATSAADHARHWPLLRDLGKTVVDLTPSRIGRMIVPVVNSEAVSRGSNVNMVSCGGQACIPLACAIAQVHGEVDYFEVVSSIASDSAGPATRANIDQYIDATEAALSAFTGCRSAKAILILNPASPSVPMQTTLSAIVKSPDLDRLRPAIDQVVAEIRAYVPGYQLLVEPIVQQRRIVMAARVSGAGDFLPAHAGNLDIINCAALATAEAHSTELLSERRVEFSVSSGWRFPISSPVLVSDSARNVVPAGHARAESV